MTTRPRPDFVNIRLSEAGVKMAGAGEQVRFANGRRHFLFRAAQVQEVERSFDWNHILRHEMYEGQPILEEVPDDELKLLLPESLSAFVEQEPGEVTDAE